MLKLIVVLFNLLAFIVVSALLPANIKVDTRLPEQFVVDSTYVIEVNISKGSIFGFAKYQQNVPAGFIAQPVSTADASFTFADGKVKFIWMALPEESEIKIAYALIATADAQPEGFLEGKFSYIEENERKSYDIPNIPIKVVSKGEAVVAKIPAEAKVKRDVVAMGNNEYQVTLNIDKKGIDGFAKMEEWLPVGATATATSTNKAVFSQVDEKAKFVWMAIPADEQLKVEYTVKASSDIEQELKSMEGSLSFLDENETKSVAVATEAPLVIAVAETTTVVAPTNPELQVAEAEVPKATEPVIAKVPEPVQPVQETEDVKMESEQLVAETPKPIAPKPAVPAPAEPTKSATTKPANVAPITGIAYKVQVLAGHKLVAVDAVQKHYKFNEAVSIENHEGWVKYTTGGFTEYKAARDKREALVAANHQFPGPFVTAYNSGQRITVQEALMISNQKWVK